MTLATIDTMSVFRRTWAGADGAAVATLVMTPYFLLVAGG